MFLKNLFKLDFHEMKYAIPLYSVIIIPKMTQIPFYHIDKSICIEYVTHQCGKSYDSWTPSGVLYFLVIKSSWSLLGSTSKYDSGRLEQYIKNLRNFLKKYAFRPEIYLEVFQVQIRTTLYSHFLNRLVIWSFAFCCKINHQLKFLEQCHVTKSCDTIHVHSRLYIHGWDIIIKYLKCGCTGYP